MAYTTINKSSVHFNTKLYTGNGSTNAITGVGFQPDLTWIKIRNAAGESHSWWDAVRTATKYISSNNTNTEATDASGLTAFDSDGFTLGSTGRVNQNTNTFASWNWKAGGAGSANTDGDINSTVSVNTTAGMSIVKWTGDNYTSSSTIGHGLGVVPAMIIIKNLDNADDWYTYHKGIGAGGYVRLNQSNGHSTSTGWMNSSTAPTNQVFTQTSTFWSASSANYIAYCFAEKNAARKTAAE